MSKSKKIFFDNFETTGYQIITPDGEVHDLPPGTRILPPQSVSTDSKEKTLDTKFRTESDDRKKFIKVFISPLEELIKSLTYGEFAILLRICQYADMNTGILGKDRGSHRTYLKISDLSELLDMNYDNLRGYIAKYKELGIIRMVSRTSTKTASKTVDTMAVCPHLILNGRYPTKEMSALFNDTKWNI